MAKENPTEPAKKPASKAEFVLGLSAEMPAAEVVKKAEEAGLTITPAHVHTIRSQAKRAAAASKDAAKPASPKKASPKKTAAKAKKAKKAATAAPETTSPVAPDATPAAAAKKPRKAVTKAKKPARASMPKAAKKAVRKGRKTSKADFVRNLPTTMSVREVIEAAKQKGIALSDTYVYMVRAQAKKAAPAKALSAAPVQPVVPEQAAQVTKALIERAKPAEKAPLPAAPTPEMVFVRLALDMGLQKARELLAAVDEKLASLVASL